MDGGKVGDGGVQVSAQSHREDTSQRTRSIVEVSLQRTSLLLIFN